MTNVRNKTDFGLGCVGTVIFLVIAAFMALVVVKSCNQPYDFAEQEVSQNPCAAAKAFAEIVRSDQRGWSRRAVVRLCGLQSPCVLPELVDLMDLKDGVHVDHFDREIIWKAIQSKARDVASTQSIPAYDPVASLATRIVQKQRWIEWLEPTGEQKRTAAR